ncbi:PQQ-binding-like beta-propeller repeat protein [Microlunatus speluncae]|uniref:PQQ-binding-like beta-propeller repeat protein n=1 Tax=Microlunatus speluncae TaxID=2594267 RepID=UPI0012663E8A|nr:PQQ-binding-like beta-propeller repeat protein [Microlunatus speluncae]
MDRRQLLKSGGLAALAGGGLTGLGTLPAHAEPAPPKSYGIAALSAAIVGFATDGSTAWCVSRGQTPPKVITFDIASQAVTRVVGLERGDGAWAAGLSGGKLYLGTYSFGDLIEYDPATGTATTLGSIGPTGTIPWQTVAAPDGVIYLGTYPRGEVWSYDPATGTLTNLGQTVPGSQYARLLTVDDQYLYVGTIPAHIIRIDRVSGEKVELLPADTTLSGLAALAVRDGKVYAGTGQGVIEINRDGSGFVDLPAPPDEYSIDALTFDADGTVIGLGRRTGHILRRDGNTMALIGQGPAGDENRGVAVLDDGRIIGACGSGLIFTFDPDSGELQASDLTADPDAAGPELLQSLCLGPGGTVAAGGHFSITVHQPSRRTTERFHVAGEPKDMIPWRDGIIAALYPSTELIMLRPNNGHIRSYGRIMNGQQRPWSIVRHPGTGTVLIASAPPTGSLQGGLTLLDPVSGDFEVRLDILPNQGLTSISLDGDLAYIAGDTWGGGGTPPTEPTSQVAIFDVATGTVVERIAPLPGQPSIQSVAVHDGILYVSYKRTSGTWIAYDLAQRTVIAQGKLSGYGVITPYRGQVYAGANFGDNLYRIGPGLTQAELLHTGIGTNWYTVPRIIPSGRGNTAWTAIDRDLTLIDLS